MKLLNKMVPLCLAAVLCFGFMVFPSFADVDSGRWVATGFWASAISRGDSGFLDVFRNYVASGSETDPDAWRGAYLGDGTRGSGFVSDLDLDLGSDSLSSAGAVWVPLLPRDITDGWSQYWSRSGYSFQYGPVIFNTSGNYFYTEAKTAPFTGTYTFERRITYYGISAIGYGVSTGTVYTKNAGSTLLDMTSWKIIGLSSTIGCVSGDLGFWGVPAAGITNLTNINTTVNSRPTSIMAPVGYYDNNNALQVVENTPIVNETNNTYYNPVTNTTTNVTNWAYDYSDRSYHLTLDSGDTVTVTYGDENITIVENGITYNVYYVVAESSSGGGDSSSSGGDSGGDSLLSTIWGWLTGGLSTLLGGIKDAILGLASIISDGFSSLISGLVDGIGGLFLPSDDSLNTWQTTVNEKLPIITDLQLLGTDFVDTLENPSQFSEKFSLDINLGSVAGGKYGTGTYTILDTSWYLPYKSTVDDVIVGFVWLVFLWNLYGEIPSIIHGGSSALQSTAGIKKWVERDDD